MEMSYDQWLEDLEDVKPEEQKNFIYHSLKHKENLPIFGRYFFPDMIDEGEEVPECQEDFSHELAQPKHSALIMPRGHGKTTWTRIDLMHDIVYHHEDFVILCGTTLTDGQRSFAAVKSQLEINEMLKEVYGDMVPRIDPKHRRKWSDSHFETNNDVICIAIGALKGRGLNIKSRRPTKAIIDDIEDREKVRVQAQRQKLYDWLFQTLMPAMDRKKGKVKMIGTVLHYDCLILHFYKKFGGIKRAAIEDKDGKPSLEGEPIWWTKDQLQEKKEEIGTFAFAQEYMNDPQSDEHSDVKLAWIKRADSVKLVDKQNRALCKVYSALDPNVSMKQRADEAAICSVARDMASEDIKIYVMNIDHGQWGITNTVTMAKRVFDRYKHEKFGVENVAFQETFRQILSTNGIPATGLHPTKDKRARLQEIVGLIEFGNIIFLPGTEDLITQLVQFPNGDHDDMVDAFVYAIMMARGSGKGFLSVTF